MHPALQRLIDANAAFVAAEQALEAARELRRETALQLAEIEDEQERWQAALLAYTEFGRDLSLALAEAATGVTGRRSQSEFLVRAGRLTHQPKENQIQASSERRPMTEWPMPGDLEREVVQSHIAHQTPYLIARGLGWSSIAVQLRPREAEIFLRETRPWALRKRPA